MTTRPLASLNPDGYWIEIIDVNSINRLQVTHS